MADDRRNQTVQLGCGTLILIAVIVMFFSRGGTGDLEREVQGLRHDVTELKRAVDGQTAEIKALRERAEKAGNAKE